jgi:hypothetical protein
METNEWLSKTYDSFQVSIQDPYGRLLEMMNRLEEGDDPKFTLEQAEFFKSLITGLIDTIRSLKQEKKV